MYGRSSLVNSAVDRFYYSWTTNNNANHHAKRESSKYVNSMPKFLLEHMKILVNENNMMKEKVKNYFKIKD